MKRVGVTAQEYRDLSRLMRDRKKAKTRLDRIDALLGRVQKDGAVIRKHVDATEQEIQQAIKDYQKKLREAEMTVSLAAVMADEAQQKAARLSLPGEAPKKTDKDFIRGMIAKRE